MHQSLRDTVEQLLKLPTIILQDINLVQEFQTSIRVGILSTTRVIQKPTFQSQSGVLNMAGLCDLFAI